MNLSSQIVAEIEQKTTTTTTTRVETTTVCYKRKKDKEIDLKNDGQKMIIDSAHQFPQNEEANILGHGNDVLSLSTKSSSATSSSSSSTAALLLLSSQTDSVTTATTTTKLSTEKQLDCMTVANADLAKYKMLLNFEEAPEHLKFNPYIRRGYRTFLSTKLCLQSVFWWTNETINIWSHLFGCFLFVGLLIFDYQFLKAHADFSDQVLAVCLLSCFCVCMLLSSIYHIFSCKSEEHYNFFLSVDFLGISLSLIAIYFSSMYYAFWCFTTLRVVYSVISLGMFVLAMIIQIPKLNVTLDFKIAVLIAWSAYGIIPVAHWAIVMGGLQHELVQLMIPRIAIMYGLCVIAFAFYAAKIPERWFTGKVDYFGHSHNWWHLFIVAAFYHWHDTAFVYAEYRSNNDGCNIPLIT